MLSYLEVATACNVNRIDDYMIDGNDKLRPDKENLRKSTT